MNTSLRPPIDIRVDLFCKEKLSALASNQPAWASIKAWNQTRIKGVSLATWLKDSSVTDDDKHQYLDELEDIIERKAWHELGTPPKGQATTLQPLIKSPAPAPAIVESVPADPTPVPADPVTATEPPSLEPKIIGDPLLPLANAMLPMIIARLPKSQSDGNVRKVVREVVREEMKDLLQAVLKAISAS